MKKIILLIFFTLSFSSISFAQLISDNAIGLRIGDNDGFGAEISYQRALAESNRLEVDLGWRTGTNFGGFKLAGIYQWVWDLGSSFNWFAGAGGGFGSYSVNYYSTQNPNVKVKENRSFLFLAGDVGIEYNFDFPLQVSADIRPEIGFGNFYDGLGLDFAIGFRYQF